MTTLKHESTKRLIASAIKAGNTAPSIEQLKTLAYATGNTAAHHFLTTADFTAKVAVKNCIASYVFGKAPEKVSDEKGTMFGKTGFDESGVADRKNVIGKPEKSEKTLEEQKDMKTRKTTEEFHPETSDRKHKSPAVSEPLKENVDPAFKKLLERGKDAQDELAKNDDRKPTPREKTAVKKTADTMEDLGRGIAFEGGVYNFAGPLTTVILDELKKNPDFSYDSISKVVYDFAEKMDQFDYLATPTGETFKNERVFKKGSVTAAKETLDFDYEWIILSDGEVVADDFESSDEARNKLADLKAENPDKQYRVVMITPDQRVDSKENNLQDEQEALMAKKAYSNNKFVIIDSDGETIATFDTDSKEEAQAELTRLKQSDPDKNYQLSLLPIRVPIEALMAQGTIALYASRIKRGENVEKVIAELIYKTKPVFAVKRTIAEVAVGDTVTVQTQNGPSNIKVDTVSQDTAGQPTLVGKDSNSQTVTIPAGTAVQTVDPNAMPANTTPAAAPVTPAPAM